MPTRQLIRPAGRTLEFGGRPVDLAIAPGGTVLYAKDNRGLVVIDAKTWAVVQELPFPEGGGSMHGIAVAPDGGRVWATSAQDAMHEASVDIDGTLAWSRVIRLPGPGGEGPSHACGIALTRGEATAYVALSRNNSVGVVDLERGELVREIPVGVAPFDVALSPDERTLYVSNWGGRRPEAGEATAPSSGTPVLVDERGIASSGTVGKVDIQAGAMVAEVATGLHPADLALDADADRLYVANANSDTVGILDVAAGSFRELAAILVRPHPDLPFGSASNALAPSADGGTLYVANGGNNAVAVVESEQKSIQRPDRRLHPDGLVSRRPGDRRRARAALVASVKGFGSRGGGDDPERGRSVYDYAGSISAVEPPDAAMLAESTAQVVEDARVP